jgi:putative ABC transport system permease protein
MLSSHLRIIFRSLFNNKRFFLINLTGLSISLCCCLLVATVVIDELSYDKFWKNANELYRIISINNIGGANQHCNYSYAALGPELKKDFPEVLDYCRMNVLDIDFKFEHQDPVKIQSLWSNDESIWDILDLTVIQGNPQKAYKDYRNVVISQKIKEEFFPDSDPVGKIIEDVSHNFSQKAIISGVIKNLPQNTH